MRLAVADQLIIPYLVGCLAELFGPNWRFTFYFYIFFFCRLFIANGRHAAIIARQMCVCVTEVSCEGRLGNERNGGGVCVCVCDGGEETKVSKRKRLRTRLSLSLLYSPLFSFSLSSFLFLLSFS